MSRFSNFSSFISTLNSSTTNLAAGNSYTFTGTAEQVNLPEIMVNLYADQVATIQIQFSQNGTNWDSTITKVTTAGFNEFTTAVKGARYARVVVTTASATTTVFRLQTQYGVFRQGNAPLNAVLYNDSDAVVVRNPYSDYELANGTAANVTLFSKFGDIQGLTTVTTPITSAGVYQTPTTAQSLEIVSSSSNDSENGTGAQQITIIGLDANWDEQTVVHTTHATDGTVASAVSGTWLRVYRMFVSRSGTYATQSAGSHVGTITLRVAAAGATWATIPLINSFPVGQTLIAAYTVPDGYKLKIEDITISASTTKTATLQFFQRINADDTSAPYTGTMRIIREYDSIDGTRNIPLRGVSTFPARTDIGFVGFTTASTANVSVDFNGYLIAV